MAVYKVKEEGECTSSEEEIFSTSVFEDEKIGELIEEKNLFVISDEEQSNLMDEEIEEHRSKVYKLHENLFLSQKSFS